MINMCYKTKNCGNLICITWLVLVSIVASCIAADKKTEAKDAVDKFLNDLREAKISKMECAYINWRDPMYAVGEKNLAERSYEYKVIVEHVSRAYLLRFEPAFTKFEFIKADPNNFTDCRMTFGFYEQDKELLRVSFCRNLSVVQINGQVFKNSAELLKALLPILPHEAYEKFYSCAMDHYVSE
jgi:hypothetical protein